MAADVVLHVRNCASCARGRVRPLRAAAALQLFPATLLLDCDARRRLHWRL